MAAGDLQRSAQVRLRPTLFALATGAPPTAIAIVRVSGCRSFAIAEQIAGTLPPPRRLDRRRLRDPATGEVLDNGLIAAFPAPASATGDDVVEIHLHGGVAIVAAVLALLRRLGATPAAAGALTRRAFDNGKIDLAAVAALGDLITAETDGQRRAALARTGSDLGRHVDRWRAALVAVRADLEATLDFAEEDSVVAILTEANRDMLADVRRELAAARRSGERAGRLRDGIVVAIVGPVNAGKSTLLNALVGRDAAMVSPHPGTTRDPIEARIVIGGVPVTLVDTAGLRATADPIEAEGIARARVRAQTAELVIEMGQHSDPNAIHVAGKADLSAVGSGWLGGILHLSPLTGDGLDLLESCLAARVAALVGGEAPLVAHSWQIAALDSAMAALDAAAHEVDGVLAAEQLRTAAIVLERVVGRVTNEAILDAVFARFCIGK